MKIESRAFEVLERRTREALDRAADDTVEVARSIARQRSRTGKYERSLRRGEIHERGGALVVRMGSPLASARPRELGAYITAKRAPYLVFKVGGSVRKVEAVRIPPHPVVAPAGRKFGPLMTARLRQGGGS